MKLGLISCAVAALISFASCDDTEPVAPDGNPELIVIDRKAALPYRIVPTAADQLTVSFYNSVDHRELKTATLLGPNGDKIATIPLSDPGVPGLRMFNGTFTYPFDPNLNYTFELESVVVNDTAFLYNTEHYRHIFKSSFTFQKLTDLSSFYDYDIDPARQTFFIIDNVPVDGFVLKKISMADLSVSIMRKPPLGFGMVRALSDHELITYTREWEGRLLKGDSSALVRFDLNNGAQQFMDWKSTSFNHVSRIVNGHVLYTNPGFVPGTSTLLNISTGERQSFTFRQVNPYSIRERNFDNLYASETIYDWSTRQFVDYLQIKDPSSILYADHQTSHTIVIDMHQNIDIGYPHFTVSGRLSVYEGTSLSFRQAYEEGVFPWLGNMSRIKDNRLIYYKASTFGFRPAVAGYYSLDLQSGQSELLHCDYFEIASENLMLDDNTMLSIRAADGVFKISLP